MLWKRLKAWWNGSTDLLDYDDGFDGSEASAFVAESDAACAKYAVALVQALDELRSVEGWTVSICCDNPDFEGPNCVIDVFGDWVVPGTGWRWNERRFEGESLLSCLEQAVKERNAQTAMPSDLNHG